MKSNYSKNQELFQLLSVWFQLSYIKVDEKALAEKALREFKKRLPETHGRLQICERSIDAMSYKKRKKSKSKKKKGKPMLNKYEATSLWGERDGRICCNPACRKPETPSTKYKKCARCRKYFIHYL